MRTEFKVRVDRQLNGDIIALRLVVERYIRRKRQRFGKLDREDIVLVIVDFASNRAQVEAQMKAAEDAVYSALLTVS